MANSTEERLGHSQTPSPLQETVDLVAFTQEILKGKLHFLCS